MNRVLKSRWAFGFYVLILCTTVVGFFIAQNKKASELDNTLLSVAEVIEYHRTKNDGKLPVDAAEILVLAEEYGIQLGEHPGNDSLIIIDGTNEVWEKIVRESNGPGYDWDLFDEVVIYTLRPTSELPYSLISEGPWGLQHEIPEYALEEGELIYHADCLEARIRQYVAENNRLPADIAGLMRLQSPPFNPFARGGDRNGREPYQHAASAKIYPGAVTYSIDYTAPASLSLCWYGKHRKCLRDFSISMESATARK